MMKKEYIKPVLKDYGDIARITLATSSGIGSGGGGGGGPSGPSGPSGPGAPTF
jgi:hypothetical protein